MCPVLGVMKQGLPEGRDPRNSQGHKRKALKSQKTSVPSVGSLDKLHQIPRAGPTTTSSPRPFFPPLTTYLACRQKLNNDRYLMGKETMFTEIGPYLMPYLIRTQHADPLGHTDSMSLAPSFP